MSPTWIDGTRRWLAAWGPTVLLAFAGGVVLAAALREWLAYRPVASVELRADGKDRGTPPLRSSSGCDYRVEISGALYSPFNGVRYDAVEAVDPDGTRWRHNCLDLMPSSLGAPRRAAPGSWMYVSSQRFDLARQRVTARFAPERLAADMYLPAGQEAAALAGALRLTLWERDRPVQTAAAAWLGALGILFLAAAGVRLRAIRELSRPRVGPDRALAPVARGWDAGDPSAEALTDREPRGTAGSPTA